MSNAAKIVLDLEDWVQNDVEAAVSAGEGASANALANRIVTEWAAARRGESPEFLARAREAVEESRRDPHPGYPVEEVFAELRARYSSMIDDQERH